MRERESERERQRARERESERARERESERARERGSERARESVCVCVSVCLCFIIWNYPITGGSGRRAQGRGERETVERDRVHWTIP
jgi:hypothetical protein